MTSITPLRAISPERPPPPLELPCLVAQAAELGLRLHVRCELVGGERICGVTVSVAEYFSLCGHPIAGLGPLRADPEWLRLEPELLHLKDVLVDTHHMTRKRDVLRQRLVEITALEVFEPASS